MNGQSYSLPLRMVFKKYHCAKCGTKLEKEKTHRIVTQQDKDYYHYHNYGKFPRLDYDVYDYRFKCPACGARITFDEQCIIEKIQKKYGHWVLSSSEIKNNYTQHKKNNQESVLTRSILFPLIIFLGVFALFCLSNPEQTATDYAGAAIICLIAPAVMIIRAVKRHKGNCQTSTSYSYSYEKEFLLKKLHTYSSNNRNLILISDKCHCFHCKAIMDSRDIQSYADNGQTAICPGCGVDSIIPDSIEEGVDAKTIAEMNEYWF